MKFSTVAAALYAVPALAAPALVKKDAASDTDYLVLQFALTLEHLEDYFYSHALRRLNRTSFFNAGYDQFYYDNLKRIADDEKSHVALLTSAISAVGGNPVNECQYNFGTAFDSVQNFVTVSSVLEGVGTSAYLGGAPLISNKDYLTVAGSILVTESLHTAYQRNAIKEVPFATPYGTPLDPTSVFTLAASFITSCPNRDYKLPFTPYPSLASGAKGALAQGATATFTANATVPANSYLTFVYGLSVTSVKATGSGSTISAAVPTAAAGQVYVLLTSGAANGTLSSAGKPIAGPAIIEVTPGAPMFLN